MKTRLLIPLALPVAAALFAVHCGKLTPVPYEPEIRVIAPAAGDTLESGTACSVRWKVTDRPGDTVTLVLAGGSGAPDTLATLPAGAGSFSWAIPLQTPAGGGYSIIVASTTDDSLYGSSGLFTIVNYADQYEPDSSAALASSLDTDGTIQDHTLPRNDRDWCVFTATAGNYYCIRTYGNTDTYLELFAPDGTTLLLHDDNGDGLNALVIWECAASGNYYIKVTAKTSGRPQNYSVNVRAVAPVLEIVFPDSGRRFFGGDSASVTWTRTITTGPAVSLYLYRGDSCAATIALATANDGSYSWTVPWSAPTAADYRIKIVSVSDSLVFDLSAPFTVTFIPASLTLTWPDSLTRWSTGSTYAIYWTRTGNTGPKAGLSLFKGDSLILAIAGSVTISDESYLYTVPLDLPTSSAYRVKITSLFDSTIFDAGDTFTITHTPSALTMTSPGSGANWITGSRYSVKWTSSGNPGTYASLALYSGDSIVRDISLGTSIALDSLSWTIPWNMPTGSAYRIKIAGISDTSIHAMSGYFTITRLDPIAVTTPSTGMVWNAGTSYVIRWSSLSATPGSYVAVYLCDSTQTTLIASSISRTLCYYNWTLPLTLRSGAAYRIKIMSTADTSAYGYSAPFTIAGLQNRITLTSPVTGDTWTAGQFFTVYWTHTGADLTGTGIMLELYSNGSLVDTVLPSTDIGDLSYFWQVPSSMPAGSTYRFRISSLAVDTVSDFSDYFTITNPALIGDAYEPDSDYTQAKTIVKDAAPQSRTLSDDYDTDWLKFAATAGTTYTIETQGQTDTYIDLYATNGITLLESDDDSGTYPNAKLVWTCPASGTYYFRVEGWDVGSYTVTLR